MSRGLGALQRRLLEELQADNDGHCDAITLASRAYGVERVSESHYQATLRALRGLCRRELVVELLVRYRGWSGDTPTGRKHFALPHVGAREHQQIAEFFAERMADLTV